MRARFIIPVLLLALAVLFAAKAPAADKVARIGIFASGINPRSAPFYQAFEQRLRDHGWVDGKNLAIDFQTAKPSRNLADAAGGLVRKNVDLILVAGPEAYLKAAKQATTTIPVVMVALNYDPVEKGYVASLARPGGNITGVFSQAPEQGAKQLELLREALPNVASIGVLWETFTADQLALIVNGASQLHVELEKLELVPPYDYERAFLTLKQRSVGAVLVVGSPVFYRDRARIAELALKHRIPAGGLVGGADAGLLLSFGVRPSVVYRSAADYVDKILRGAKPADLPVEQPTQYELTINLRTAKALGLTIPRSLLLRADEVIE